MGKTGAVRKHIPQRMCVGCRTVLAKRTLVRLVRGPDGVRIDPTGKAAGRGAYLHSLRGCWERGLRESLAAALKTELTPTDREMLAAFLQTLPAGDGADLAESGEPA